MFDFKKAQDEGIPKNNTTYISGFTCITMAIHIPSQALQANFSHLYNQIKENSNVTETKKAKRMHR